MVCCREVEDGSEETACSTAWAAFFSFAAAETSGGVKNLAGGFSLERSITLLESLAAAVNASFVHWSSMEKEMEEGGFFQFSWIFRRVSEIRSL